MKILKAGTRNAFTSILLLLAAMSVHGQSGMTAVTGTIACYANGSVQASWINGNPTSPTFPNLLGYPFAQQVPSNMNSAGTWTMNLSDVNLVQPQPSQWKITACAKGGSQPYCTTHSITITGTSQNVSSNFSDATCPPGSGGIVQLTQDVLAGPVTSVIAAPATVVGIQHNAVANTTPVQNAVPNWNVATSRYEIAPLTLDQIGAAFAITGFTCSTCATVEIGATIASPTNFTATYTSAATNGTVSDGVNTSPMSPPNATSQSGSLAHSYTSSVAATMAFTLTAVAATTKTATQTIHWVPRSFGGTGADGSATGATASGNAAVLVGATGTLIAPTSGAALSTICVGQVYNVTTSGTQYVYLLIPCNVSNPTAGSFTVPGPSVFPMNTPTTVTFTNQFAAPITMYLYRSVNSFFTGSNSIITVGN